MRGELDVAPRERMQHVLYERKVSLLPIHDALELRDGLDVVHLARDVEQEPPACLIHELGGEQRMEHGQYIVPGTQCHDRLKADGFLDDRRGEPRAPPVASEAMDRLVEKRGVLGLFLAVPS